MEIRAVFAENLKKYRRSAGFSQEDLAHYAGIERAYVSMLERKQSSPTIDMLAKLAKALEIEPYQLIAPIPRRSRKTSD